jgi:hypothetical protein
MTPKLQAIETMYRGCRMRSRTEARWAVFFDAAGIEWQYEVEGYNLDGQYYLPDFWLPELKTYVEAKPTEVAAVEAAPLLLGLEQAAGCKALFAIGSPTVGSDHFYGVEHNQGQGALVIDLEFLKQCLFCDRLCFESRPCPCLGAARVVREPRRGTSRLLHALGEAQRARFEHGENGIPRPYKRRTATGERDIFLEIENNNLDKADFRPWRDGIRRSEDPVAMDGGEADVLFAWVDAENLRHLQESVERTRFVGKPVFVAFASEELLRHFDSIGRLADVAVVTPDVQAAWRLFAGWQDNRIQ